MKNKFALLACVCILALTHVDTYAAEGGGSHYLQGTYGDFAMALTGPPGFYMRNDLMFMTGTVGPVSHGNYILDDFKQDVWVNAFRVIYMAASRPLGATPGVVLGLPYVLNAKASGAVIAPVAFAAEDSGSGLSDPYVYGFLNWNLGGYSHLTAGITIFSDFGSYDAERIINFGRNYWSFDPIISYTWLNTDNGREFSMTTGFMFNTENEATDYQTGTEFHLDWMLAQHLPNNIAVGLEGYYYAQVTDDEGVLVNAIPVGSEGFRSGGWGLGPALSWTPKILEKDVTLTAKWIHDFEASNRFDADVAIVAFALKF
jgi:hypothetical protein